MTSLNSPNTMHILSGGSYATLNIDKSILWHDRKTSLKSSKMKNLKKKKVKWNKIKFKPTFDQIKQFEKPIFQFPTDIVETIAWNYHWVHRQISRTSQKPLVVVSGNRSMT